MGQNRNWTREELDYIREVWGEKTVPEIAAKLGRSINAVKVKTVRLGYTGQKWCGEMMSARKVSELLGVDVHTVTDFWIPKCNLKAKAKRLGVSKRTTTIIMFEDLLSWLQEHQDLWDSRRVPEYALGVEYKWLRAKRENDKQLPARRLQKWTSYEDQQLIIMFKRGDRTQAQIAKELNRSLASVNHRLARLDVWGDGRHISDEELKEKREAKEKKALASRLIRSLITYRNSQEFGEFWQKDMCQHWDKTRGCCAGQVNCDECSAFLRILPQHCARCGATFFERAKTRFCEPCRLQRKKNGYKKYLKRIGQ
jgi:DNA-binding CsgD family transcriptional regulator